MSKVTSKDGTRIAYDRRGQGPAVILVDGALGYRGLGFGNPLAELLSRNFTVYCYDRRGRGESSNSKPFTIDREVEDINALIDQAGGSAYVYGMSSGACLALEAAIRLGSRIKKLALFEPPYNSDPSALSAWKAYWTQLHELIAANRRSEAVDLFMRFVGTPTEMVQGMRNTPVWAMFEAVAPTLPYDAAEVGEDLAVPVERARAVHSETLILDGGLSLQYMPFMHATAVSLAEAIPHARQVTLDGQGHDIKAEVLAPALAEFFGR